MFTRTSTKSATIYILLPNNTIIISNSKNYIRFIESCTSKVKTYSYSLPSKGIALEEYLDYIVINIGSNCDETQYRTIMEIALIKNKGLILKPIEIKDYYVIDKYYYIDKLIINHNKLNGFENISFYHGYSNI